MTYAQKVKTELDVMEVNRKWGLLPGLGIVWIVAFKAAVLYISEYCATHAVEQIPHAHGIAVYAIAYVGAVVLSIVLTRRHHAYEKSVGARIKKLHDAANPDEIKQFEAVFKETDRYKYRKYLGLLGRADVESS